MTTTLQRGIQAVRDGDKTTAYQLLKQAIREDPENERAWLWMSAVVTTKDRRIDCLKRVLALNPENKTAIKGLRKLEGTGTPTTRRRSDAEQPAEGQNHWFDLAYIPVGIGIILVLILSGLLINTLVSGDEQAAPLAQSPSATPTATSLPTSTDVPTATPLPTAMATPTTGPEPTAVPYTVQVDNMGDHLVDVYLRGQELGRDPHSFSKVGDCHSEQEEFFYGFDTGQYNLGAEYAYLEPAIHHFEGSFSRDGKAAFAGFKLDTLLDPFWTSDNCVMREESLYGCELRLHNPSIVLIYVQPNLIGPRLWPDLYRESLTEAVTYALDQGIIPVLGTQFIWDDRPDIVEDTNIIIREVGDEYNVPVWDLYTSTSDLGRSPDRGNWHMSYSPYSSTDFTDLRNMEYGMTIRNLEGLQILHMIMNDVMLATEETQ